jgi:hypothetical protein
MMHPLRCAINEWHLKWAITVLSTTRSRCKATASRWGWCMPLMLPAREIDIEAVSVALHGKTVDLLHIEPRIECSCHYVCRHVL